MNKFFNKEFWGRLKDALLIFLKDKFVEKALVTFLKSPMAGGFKVWLITFLSKKVFDDIGEPLIKAGLVEIGYVKNKIEGKLTNEKIDKARIEKDATAYHNAVNNVFD